MYGIQGGIFMNSILKPITGMKVLLVSALCSAALTACYVQPHSQTGIPGHSKATQMQNFDVETMPVGRYALSQGGTDSAVIIDVAKTGLALPAKEIKINLSSKATGSNCHYQGTATLMGQDALHGMIYTAPVSSITSANNAPNLNIPNDKGLLFFRFKDNVLSLDSNNPQALSLLCQGKVELTGDYARLK